MDPSRSEAGCVDFVGDAQILVTGPFYPSADPLAVRPTCEIPADGVLDPGGRLVTVDRLMDHFLRGSLTFGNPPIDLLTQFEGTERFETELAAVVERLVELPVKVTVTGMLFPDGYGSIAVLMEITDGWATGNRRRLTEGFGPKGRDTVAARLRDAMLPALADISDRCCPNGVCETVVPYFNQTYVATTTHPRPGRATLPDDLRFLIYPRTPAPIASDSPWSDEFFYAGYAFNLLASAEPKNTLAQLEHLLLNLDVLYARMNNSGAAADQLVRSAARDGDVDWLVALERRLRADYQALVQPTFSYDYHVLKLRDSLLYAWETDKTRERTETMLEMARQAVERQLAQEQAGRVARVNLVVTLLTVCGFVASLEAAVNLLEKIF